MVEITCKVDYKNYEEFFFYTQTKIFKILKILGWIVAGFGLLYGVCACIDFVAEDFVYDMVYTIIEVACGMLFAYGIRKISLNSFKKAFNSNKLYTTNTSIYYQLNETNFRVLTTGALGIEDCTYSYKIITKAVETKNAFYLFISTNASHVIPKSSSSNEVNGKISDTLKEILKDKYILDIK